MKKGFLHNKSYRTTLQGGYMNSSIIKKKCNKKSFNNNLLNLCVCLIMGFTLVSCATPTREIAQENSEIQVDENYQTPYHSHGKRLERYNNY